VKRVCFTITEASGSDPVMNYMLLGCWYAKFQIFVQFSDMGNYLVLCFFS
jgi:hypothetical protein